MALEQRLNLKQTLQLRMTPQLRQAIKILQVSRAELETIVGDELCENPALEENETPPENAELETRTGDVETTETEAPEAAVKEKEEEASDLKEVDWEEFLERHSSDVHGSIGTGSDRDDNKTSFIENTAGNTEDIVTAMLAQLSLIMMSDEERRVATVIVHNLDRNGYLAGTREEIAALAECSVEFLDEAREIIGFVDSRSD